MDTDKHRSERATVSAFQRSEFKLQLVLHLRLCGRSHRFMDQNRTEIAKIIKNADFCSHLFTSRVFTCEQTWEISTRLNSRVSARIGKNTKNADFCSGVFGSRCVRSEQTSQFFELGDIPRTYYPRMC